MSTYFKEKNNESTFELFNKRTIYTAISDNKSYTNLINFSAEKILYGKVNRTFIPMTIPQTANKLKSFPGKSTTSSNLRALNFVVDAFTDLQKQFEKCRLLGKIDPSDEYLSSLQVYKAYVDPHSRYESYLNLLNSSISQSTTINSQKLKDFNMLTDNLMEAMNSSGRKNPLTFPAFIKSRKTPINVSGLAIEIADLDASNDDVKFNNFIESKNWDFFINTCRTYGFMVDKDVPWRLVADIGSQPMLEYAGKYGMKDTNNILYNCYEPASYSYYNSFTQRMLDLYYTIKPKRIIEVSECKGKTKINRIKPKEYKNTQILQESYGQESFLMLYCKLRFTEEETQYTEDQKNIIIKDILQISKSESENYAIDHFERFLNKTFDYQGSLSYYVKENKAREEKEIFGEARTAGTTQTTGY